MKNTIQIIGICLSNLALLIYTALQIDQIGGAVGYLRDHNTLKPDPVSQNIWGAIRPFLITIPIVIAVTTIAAGFMSWKLYREFAWDILKQIGADYRMKKRFFFYQVRAARHFALPRCPPSSRYTDTLTSCLPDLHRPLEV